MLSFLPATVFPRAPSFALPSDSVERVVAEGAMMSGEGEGREGKVRKIYSALSTDVVDIV